MNNKGNKFLIIFLTFALVFGFSGRVFAVNNPTLETVSATSITKTSATLTGKLVRTGGAVNTIRGFQYDTNNSTLTNSTTEAGSFDLGYISKFGSSGSGNGQFGAMKGIDFDSQGNIYVVDSSNNRVQKFNSSGVYVSQFGSFGIGNGEFSTPYGIAIDSQDNIYVSDDRERVQKFDSTGVYITTIGTSGGTADGAFENAYGIAIDSADNLYVVDPTNFASKNLIPRVCFK